MTSVGLRPADQDPRRPDFVAMSAMGVDMPETGPLDQQTLCGKVRRRWKCLSKCVVGGFLAVIIIRVAIDQVSRRAMLSPLLSALRSSAVCHAPRYTNSTQRWFPCDVVLDREESASFDLHPAENSLFGYIYVQLVDRNDSLMTEILSGAHAKVVVDNRKDVYKFLHNLPGAKKRISSHKSDSVQFGLPEGRILGSLLVGGWKNSTWLQLEAHPWGAIWDPVNNLGHICDYIQYKLTGRNIGPLGTSSHTDQNPLSFHQTQVSKQECPTVCAPKTRRISRFRVQYEID
eukprot:TRINITY_DN6081_c1_g5_i1.p1 TRINITY_DN6081_c1_g5~~TRINITY_DN6081_c1_g5_i1.p1  ORF type:complete len:316 (+),score=17.57 TRINITY_DN6081_c1_g5_i1:85-948(+)